MRLPDSVTFDPFKIMVFIAAIVLSIIGKVSWYVTILIILSHSGVTMQYSTRQLLYQLRYYWRKIKHAPANWYKKLFPA
jgi:cell division protein FtsL